VQILSQTAEYAVRAVVYLASAEPGRLVRVGEVAEAIGVPQNYLSKTLHQLVRAGVLASTRGPAGGFRLASPAERMTLVDVVAPFDSLEPRGCLLGRPVCSDRTACPAHWRWKPVTQSARDFLEHTTVADLASDRTGRR
jgi:Rrf2 family protein